MSSTHCLLVDRRGDDGAGAGVRAAAPADAARAAGPDAPRARSTPRSIAASSRASPASGPKGSSRDEQYALAREELERRLLRDVADDADGRRDAARHRARTAIVIAIALPVLAFGVYALFGEPARARRRGRSRRTARPTRRPALRPPRGSRPPSRPQSRATAAPGCCSRAWISRPTAIADAAQAYGKGARRLAEDRAPTPASGANTPTRSAWRRAARLAGQPRELVQRALALDPAHPKALEMAGSAAFEQRDYAAAVRLLAGAAGAAARRIPASSASWPRRSPAPSGSRSPPAQRRRPADERDRRRAAGVIVIGGGISGLAAAFGLQQRGAAVEVLEANARAGGVIGTQRRDGALYETGPNSALDTSPLINELLDALAIRGERADASAVAATRFIVRGGRLIPLPTVPRRLPHDPGVLAAREAAPAARAVHRARAGGRRGIDRRVRAPPPRHRVPRLRDRPVRRPASMPAIRSGSRCRPRFRACTRWSRSTAA